MIFSDFVNAPPSENGGVRRFLRRKNRIENEEGRGFGRGTALEQSESGAGQNIGPGGADDQLRGFAERNATEWEQAPGFCRWGAGAAEP